MMSLKTTPRSRPASEPRISWGGDVRHPAAPRPRPRRPSRDRCAAGRRSTDAASRERRRAPQLLPSAASRGDQHRHPGRRRGVRSEFQPMVQPVALAGAATTGSDPRPPTDSCPLLPSVQPRTESYRYSSRGYPPISSGATPQGPRAPESTGRRGVRGTARDPILCRPAAGSTRRCWWTRRCRPPLRR